MENWIRNEAPEDIPVNDLEFQIISSHAHDVFNEETDESEFTIHLFGCDSHGNSVGATILGFCPYFYVEIPEILAPIWTIKHNKLFEGWLNLRLRDIGYGIKGVKMVEMQKLYPFTNQEKFRFLRLIFSNGLAMKKAVWLFQKGPIKIPRIGVSSFEWKLYDNTVDGLMRFTQCANIKTTGWISIREWMSPNERTTTAQIDIETNWRNVKPVMCDTISPFIMASFDIECFSEDAWLRNRAVFPNSAKRNDIVAQIGTTLWKYGTSEVLKHIVSIKDASCMVKNQPSITDYFYKTEMGPGRLIRRETTRFVLEFEFGIGYFPCDLELDYIMVTCECEEDILREWTEFIKIVDNDIWTGYNINGFDWKYMVDRDQWGYLGSLSRIRDLRSELVHKEMKSAAYGVNKFDILTCHGRICIDLLTHIRREKKFESYKLNAVAKALVGHAKHDLAPLDIFLGLVNNVTKVARYCIQDTFLVYELVKSQLVISNLLLMAAITRVPVDWLLTRGQQIKVFSQIAHACRKKKIAVPFFPKKEFSGEKFVGATVLTAKRGAYMEDPISGLDFASLYPSIMIAHNLCYSTLVTEDKYRDLPGVEYKTIDWWVGDKHFEYCFVTSIKGVLPELLEDLWKERKIAKKAKSAARAAGDINLYNVKEGEQLGIKVSMNSIYGFTGAVNGILPCKPIAASTTTYGRLAIEHTKKLVEEWYDCDVVYGDTDSCYVRFNVPKDTPNRMHEIFRLSIEAADRISDTFQKPMELEFEKVMFPFMLFSKKRYAYQEWINPNGPDHIDYKGLQTVRRDSCLFVRELCIGCYNDILRDRDIPRAKERAQQGVRDLLEGRVNLHKLTMSKSLREDYKTDKLPHVHLAKKMMERDPMKAPRPGERVQYVFIRGTGLQYTRTEDPEYALENNIPIDYLEYLERQLRKPLETPFELLLDDTADLYRDARRTASNKQIGQREITSFFY